MPGPDWKLNKKYANKNLKYISNECSKKAKQCMVISPVVIPRGPTGPTGPTGPAGPPGATGPTGSNINECLPERGVESNIQDGDLVAIGKDDGFATVHKLLCQQWEWAAAIDNEIGGIAVTPQFRPTIAVDGCGNIYVAGLSLIVSGVLPKYWDADYNGNTSTSPSLSGSATQPGLYYQVVVGKISPAGRWIWSAAVDITSNNNLSAFTPSIAVDRCGNAYVTGVAAAAFAPKFYNTLADGNTDTNIALTGRASTNTGVFLAKISTEGVWQWVAAVDSSSLEFNPKVATDGCGAVYLTGLAFVAVPEYYDALPNGNTSSTVSLTGKAGISTQIFVGKISETGRWVWTAAIDSTEVEFNPSIAADGCGNVYVSGTTAAAAVVYYDTQSDGNTSNIPSPITSKTGTRTFIHVGKLSSEGVWLWSAVADSANEEDNSSLVTDGRGNIYLSGSNFGSGSVKYYDAVSQKLSVIGSDAPRIHLFLAKLKPTGRWEWGAAVAPVSSNNISNLASDGCGNVYLVGDSIFTAEFYNGVDDGSLTSTIIANNTTLRGVFVGKIHPDGDWEWVASVDGPSNDEIPAVASDYCGNVYVAGQSSNIQYFYDAGANGNTLTNYSKTGRTASNTEIFVGKIANDAASAPLIGIARTVDDIENEVCVDFSGPVDNLADLQPGCTYYINCARDPTAPDDQVHSASLTTDGCADCCCPNRRIGVACDTSTLVLKVDPPKCRCKSKCCCCSSFKPRTHII